VCQLAGGVSARLAVEWLYVIDLPVYRCAYYRSHRHRSAAVGRYRRPRYHLPAQV